ncbi:hypothetical protein BGW36DRAFT_361722 [Talaromyces proteolyticus]|uniref:Uncharacterized protein n=1 Tax=Talaromyces proteolyticus TaxID=1131652 RepID=A0AAD4PXP8_9EURO|nr:uncharacterized protein BGW36DRAFT_361722 [Talaromyces proteolyticus]KAH8693895.1 hypothetical protein BGW36DRAFT_361722 [Talaromyces proteolyticus]
MTARPILNRFNLDMSLSRHPLSTDCDQNIPENGYSRRYSPIDQSIYNHFQIRQPMSTQTLSPSGFDYRAQCPGWGPQFSEYKLVAQVAVSNKSPTSQGWGGDEPSTRPYLGPPPYGHNEATRYSVPEYAASEQHSPQMPYEEADSNATEEMIETGPESVSPPAANTNYADAGAVFPPSRCQYIEEEDRKVGRGQSQPCSLNVGKEEHLRKTISHIFGRNKLCTSLIPDEGWVWWCRKHYQQQRYKRDSWAKEQILVLKDTLDKLEAWGGIETFTIALRKREKDSKKVATDDEIPATRRRVAGRPSKPAATTITTTAPSQTNETPKFTKTGRRICSPVNIASPVPQHLLQYVGEERDFAGVRALLDAIDQHIEEEWKNNNKEVPFPDIEILPNFTKEVLQSKGIPCGAMSANNHSRRRRARVPEDTSKKRARVHRYEPDARF